MEIELTVNYNVPGDEFKLLGDAYPLGKYINCKPNERVQWFKLEIPGDKGKIVLTWFRSWTE